MSLKTALVVSGGGAKGAFAVGVLAHLFDTYRDTGWFSITGGTSTGALIAPIAAVMGAEEPVASQARDTLVRLYSTVTTRDVLDEQTFELAWRRDCLNESDPLNDLLHHTLNDAWFNWLHTDDRAPDCYVVYTNYQTGRKVVVTAKDPGLTRERFIQAMLASASVPVIMEATIIDGAACFDGGVRDLLPMGEAIHLGAERIVPVFLSPAEYTESWDRYHKFGKILLRTLDMLVDEAGKNDLEMAKLINLANEASAELADALQAQPEALDIVQCVLAKARYADVFGPKRRLLDIIEGLRPNHKLTDDSLSFDPAKMKHWIHAGEIKAAEVIDSSPFG